MLDANPIPLRLYLAQGLYKGLQEASMVVAAFAFLVFVFSLQGGENPSGQVPFSSQIVPSAGVVMEGGQ